MATRSKLLLAALTAALLLTLGAGAAQATSFSTANTELLDYTSPALTFLGDTGTEVICAVTLRASLHRSTAKIRGALIGHVTEGRTERCRSSVGTATEAIPLACHRAIDDGINLCGPWHLQYDSFRGTLPRIEEIRFTVVRARFLLRIGNLSGFTECLYVGDVLTAATGRVGPRELTIETLTPQPNTARIFRILAEEFFGRCPRTGELRGRFTSLLRPVIRLT